VACRAAKASHHVAFGVAGAGAATAAAMAFTLQVLMPSHGQIQSEKMPQHATTVVVVAVPRKTVTKYDDDNAR